MSRLKDIDLAGRAGTWLGSFCSAFSDVTAVVLGTAAVKAAIERSAVKPEDVEEEFIENLLSGGLRPNTARKYQHRARLPRSVPATTIFGLRDKNRHGDRIGLNYF